MFPDQHMILSLTLPSLVAALLAFFIVKKIKAASLVSSILMLSAVLVSHYLIFETQVQYPWFIPGGFTVLVGTALLIWLGLKPLSSKTKVFDMLLRFILPVSIMLFSFPWWHREGSDRLIYFALSFSTGVFVVSLSAQLSDKAWQSIRQIALLVILSAALLVMMASTTHLFLLLTMIVSAAMFAVVSALKKQMWIKETGGFYSFLVLSILVANASYRFVANPDSDMPEKDIIIGAAFLYLWTPTLVLFIRNHMVRTLVYYAVFILSIGLAAGVYFNETEQVEEESYDYGSFQ